MHRLFLALIGPCGIAINFINLFTTLIQSCRTPIHPVQPGPLLQDPAVDFTGWRGPPECLGVVNPLESSRNCCVACRPQSARQQGLHDRFANAYSPPPFDVGPCFQTIRWSPISRTKGKRARRPGSNNPTNRPVEDDSDATGPRALPDQNQMAVRCQSLTSAPCPTAGTGNRRALGLRFCRSGRGDSNPRPPAPKAGALPDCATPRMTQGCRAGAASPLRPGGCWVRRLLRA